MISIIILLILFILLILLIVLINRQRFYFNLKQDTLYTIDHILTKVNIDNHYALCYKDNKYNNCLLISHGNSSNIYNSQFLIHSIKKIYKGNIYCYEYPEFGKCKTKLSIKNCINEHLFWLDYISKIYTHIDLWGYSIGGGIISQTIKYIPNNISNKIHKIYYHNTFSSIKNVIKHNNIFLFILYKLLLIDDFNTIKEFTNDFYKDKEIIILHSKNDNFILYEEALTNFNKCKSLKLNVKLIDIIGSHSSYILDTIS
jgi:hypothetical protein